MRAVFMGSDSFSVPILRDLITLGPGLSTPVETVGVVSQPDRPAGRGREASPNAVKELAQSSSVGILQPERVREPEALQALAAMEPDVIVVAAFGQLLPSRLLEMPRYGCLNLHPSLLPRFRGASPVAGAILAGERETGTTIMLMVRKMDAGPIVAQEKTPIGDAETAGELSSRLAEMSGDLLVRTLPKWVTGRATTRPQEEDKATYTQRIRKEDGWIDWRLSAEELSRRVRAYNPWPVAYTSWEGERLRILRARAGTGGGHPGRIMGVREEAVAVGTGSNVLLLEEIQLAARRPTSALDFLRGHPRFGGALLGMDGS